jgi:hypothetical protein
VPQIEITVVDRKADIRKISRPLSTTGDGYAIAFRHKKWPIDHTLVLDVRTASPLPETAKLVSATARDLAELLSASIVAASKSQQQSKRVDKTVVRIPIGARPANRQGDLSDVNVVNKASAGVT